MLRDYQVRIISKLREQLRTHRRPVVVAPTGSGKTHIATDIVANCQSNNARTLFLAPRRELIYQTLEKFQSYNIDSGMIMAGEYPNLYARHQVASFDTLHARGMRSDKILMPEADVILVDECFVAGTLVDGTPIEKIKIDTVLSTGKVINISKRKVNKIIKITLTDKNSVVCTLNHPILTDKGWVEAGCIDCYTKVVAISGYTNEFGKIKNEKLYKLSKFFSSLCSKTEKDMLSRVFNSMEERKRPSRTAGLRTDKVEGNDRKQSNEKSGNEGESVGISQGDGLEACRKERKRSWPDCSRIIVSLCAWMGERISYTNKTTKGFWVSNLLQSRCWEQGFKNSNRSRWKFSWRFIKKTERQKERSLFNLVGVESVKVHKQGSGNEFKQLCKNGFVYNLEVSNSNVYFANGILVHNCHLSMAKTKLAILNYYKDKIVIGLTATPARSDGTGLGEFYDSMVNEISVRELIDLGHLVEPEYYAPSEYDLTGVKQTKSDYVVSSLAVKVDQPKLIGDIYDNWENLAFGKRTVIFCTSRSHSRHVRDEFLRHGITAEHVDGETPKDERKDIFDRVRSGTTQVLCNVFVASYGLDIPVLECAVLARPTKNLSLYIQTCGRVLRPAPGKDKAIIIDHTGAIARHGFLDDPIPWTLDGDDIRELKQKQDEANSKPKEITCSQCGTVFSGQRECPKCGYASIQPSEEVPVHAAQLEKVDVKQKRANKDSPPEVKREFYGMLMHYSRGRGYKDGWAANQYRQKFGVWPNKYKNTPMIPPNTEVQNYIKSRQIAYFKGKGL